MVCDDVSAAWYLDSGATNHITPDADNLSSKVDYKGKSKVLVGNGNSMPIFHIGFNSFTAANLSKALVLRDILHVPNATKNLLSISQFTKDNNIVLEFDSTCCLIKDKITSTVLLWGMLSNGLYKLNIPPSTLQTTSTHNTKSQLPVFSPHCPFNSTTTSNPVFDKSQAANIWHCRLGHPSTPVLHKVLSIVHPTIKCNSISFCEACKIGKLHQFSFKLSINKTTAPFELLYSDVWGPSFYSSLDGYRYYVSFVDDFTKYTWIFPMHVKSEVQSIFTCFNAYVQRVFDTKIKSIQTDMGSEYKPLYNLFQQLGIIRGHSCPHTHQQQGQIERKHRHVVDVGLTLLAQYDMPLKFWWEVFVSAAFLISRLPTPTHFSLCLLSKSCSTYFLTIIFLKLLAAPVFHCSDHINNTKCHFYPQSVYFLAIVPITRDTNACIPLAASILLEVSPSMKQTFLILRYFSNHLHLSKTNQ